MTGTIRASPERATTMPTAPRKPAAKKAAPARKKPTSAAPPKPAAKARKAATKPKAAPSTPPMTPDQLPEPVVFFDKPTRYREPKPPRIDVEAFRQTVITRRSVRKFTDKPIPKAVLDDCLDMAMLAPNSSNLQPWSFYVIKSPAIKKQMVTACMGQNAARTAQELIAVVARTGTYLEHARMNVQQWPGEKTAPKVWKDYYEKLVPVLYTQGPLNSLGLLKKGVASVYGRFRPAPRGPFSHADMKVWAVKSAALAAENLMLAFRAHGFDTCPMEGFDEARVNKLLKLPSDGTVIMIIGAGERAEDGVYYPQMRFDRRRFIHEV
jgi:nitroreductase